MRRSPGAGEQELSDETVRALRVPLLRWYRRNRRDLPWRRLRDPYAIWVSEIMLQQTRVAVVVPYYQRFLERFPDVHALAEASEDRVLAAWSGLGYYRRARNLHAAARLVVDRHGGRLPEDVARLRALPGIGRYTAGAIASVAYGRPAGIVDGNVSRVFARVFRIDPRGASGRQALWSVAEGLSHGPSPGDLNQALMELGAAVCTPRSPDCSQCPVAEHCDALRRGDAAAWPPPEPGSKSVSVFVAVAVIEHGGRVLLAAQTVAGPLRGAWDLPAVEIASDREGDRQRMLEEGLAERQGIRVRVESVVAAVSHSILRRRLRLTAYRCRLEPGQRMRSRALRWVRLADIDHEPISGATRKVLLALHEHAAEPAPV